MVQPHHMIAEMIPRAIVASTSLVLVIVQVVLNEGPHFNTNVALVVVGIAMVVLGFLLWLWTGAHMQKRDAFKNKTLCADGPFALTRHPMYVGGYIFLIGIGLAFFSKAWFIVLVLALPFWYIAFSMEEKRMIEIFGEKYIAYQRKVWMLLPSIFARRTG